MNRQQIRDLVELVPESRLADFTAESLRIGCSPDRAPRQQIDDLLLALECIERLIVRAAHAAEQAQNGAGERPWQSYDVVGD